MNYMYGEGAANELEAREVVRKIRFIVDSCEPDVRCIVQQSVTFPADQHERFLQQMHMHRAMAQSNVRSALADPQPFGGVFGGLW